jgi:hypothetical protein
MARRVSFWATKIKKVPTKVSFRTRSGRRVSFRATKLERVPKKVTFYSRRRR